MKRHWIALAAGLWIVTSAQAIDEAGARALMKQHGCDSCHEIDKKLIGPAFRDVAVTYKADKGASAKLQNKVKKGGAHTWGDIAMPPNILASDADIKTLVDWILTLQK
jgi:cytochrome c